MTIRFPSPEVMQEIIKKAALGLDWTKSDLKTALIDIHQVDEYFTDPSRWCKGAGMRDSKGQAVARARYACSHCLAQASGNFMKARFGATLIIRTLAQTNFTKGHSSLDRYGGPSVPTFNDHPKVTFTHIKNLLRCIKRGLREHLDVPSMQKRYVDQLKEECNYGKPRDRQTVRIGPVGI